MATGAYDANGIWQYGEDDNIALFSDLLNLGTESTSDAFTDDRARLATLEAGSLSGLIPVSPSTVTAVTGSAAVNTLGVITFTGCSAIRIDGVFDSKYKNYRVLINYSGNLNPNVPSFRLRASGTDNTANAYYYSGYSSRTSGSIGLWAGNGVSFVDLGRSNTTASATSIDFYNPFQATNTPYSFNSAQYDNTGLLSQGVNGIHYASTAYDGFSFYDTAGGGVLTGTLQVFGYND